MFKLTVMSSQKELFRDLVSKIKAFGKREDGKPLRNEDIAAKLHMSREYFSTLTGTKGEVNASHVQRLGAAFFDLLKEYNISVDGHTSFNRHYAANYNPTERRHLEDDELIQEIASLDFQNRLRAKSVLYFLPKIDNRNRKEYLKDGVKAWDNIDREPVLSTMIKYSLAQGTLGWAYFAVEGDEAQPYFKDGDLLLCKRTFLHDPQAIQPDIPYLVIIDGKLIFSFVVVIGGTTLVLLDPANPKKGRPISLNDVTEMWEATDAIIKILPSPTGHNIYEILSDLDIAG